MLLSTSCTADLLRNRLALYRHYLHEDVDATTAGDYPPADNGGLLDREFGAERYPARAL